MTDNTIKSSRNNSAKMLVTSGPVNAASPTINSGLSSPTGEMQDENSNKLMIYLHRLAGNHEVEIDVIMKDHAYARPWNWKPESIFVRPAKKLFFSKSTLSARDHTKEDNLIDVEDNDTDTPIPPFDLSKVRQTMDEFQRVANFIRSEDIDDWEEKIDKILWSPVQNRIFNRVVRILNSERTARLAKEKSLHEPIIRRTSIDATAKKFRESLASANWDWRVTQWLHSLLFDHLPQDYLTIYLDILQALRQKIPQLIDKMISVQPNVNSKSSSVTWETLAPLLKKTWDPVGPALNTYRSKKLPGNPILIVVPNGMSNNMSSRQHKWVALFGILGTVVTVNPNLGLNANRMTVLSGVEQIVQATRNKIQDVKVDYPGRPVVLIGLNTGAGIACQIGVSEHVSAIVCLGFPLSTADGKRGTPDDLLLDLRCPLLFVIGECASLSRIDDVEELRERMLVPTGLVVVGSADNQLRISTSKKISERLSQSMVDRCVLDEIADFVGGVLTQPSPVPVRTSGLPNNCEAKGRRINDARKRKNSTSSSVDSEPQSPNIKKSKPHSPTHPSNISMNSLPRGTMVTLTGTAATQTPKRKARSNFKNFSEQQMSRPNSQKNLDNSTGGITLNIGSLASLAPVGPIRFDSTPISLQVSPVSGKPGTGTIKTSANTFIKVPKGSHHVNVAGPAGQGVAKIKMLMPTKKASTPRSPANYKNINVTDKTGDSNAMNVHAPTTTSAGRVNASFATAANTKIPAGSASYLNSLPSIQASKNVLNSDGSVSGRLSTGITTNLVTRNPSAAQSTMTTSTIPTKVAESQRRQTASATHTREHQPCGPPRPRSGGDVPRLVTSSASRGLNNRQACLPRSRAQNQERSAAKPNIVSTNTNHPHQQGMTTNTMTTTTSTTMNNVKSSGQSKSTSGSSTGSLNDGLENILDIPIIIAKDGENLSNLEHLNAPPVMPPLQICSNKLFLINNRLVQPPAAPGQPIKYAKIILTRRADEEVGGPIVFTKNAQTGNLQIPTITPKVPVERSPEAKGKGSGKEVR